MSKDQFIVNKSKIEEKRKLLTQTSTSSDGWKINYIDEENNENWIEYGIHPEYHGGGYPILVKQPEPNTDELITIAIQSNNLDQIAGVAVFLYTNEKYDKIEFRDKLIESIEDFFNRKKDNLTEFDKKKLNTMIYDSSLYDPSNRRPILGKKQEEIEIDFQFFKKISERAKRILSKLK